MPVVELDRARLLRLVGAGRSDREILSMLPFLGLDIEGTTRRTVRVEYSPNRPDYSTAFGVANGLRGLLGVSEGMIRLDIKRSGYLLRTDPSVSRLRPWVTALVAKGGPLGVETLKDLITMQEDLHSGLGRGRRKSSMGIHDMDAISFPVTYSAAKRTRRFVPLHHTGESPVSEILKVHPMGAEYGHLLGRSGMVPLIEDADGAVVSLPPIINAAATEVTARTRNLFVEVTGTSPDAVQDALSVAALTLHGAGFTLYNVKTSGDAGATARLRTRTFRIDPGMVRDTLGLDLPAAEIAESLRRSRLDADIRGGRIICVVPRYRFDVLNEMDIVEEVALGYGVWRMEPATSSPSAPGRKDDTALSLQHVRETMIGLGYSETLSSSLTSPETLYEKTGRDPSGAISVLDSKSREHTVLRDSLIPGMIAGLARNIHEPYPQRLFEVGTVFTGKGRIREQTRLCAACAHADASFSELRSVLQSIARYSLGAEVETTAQRHPFFEPGRSAGIAIDSKSAGVIGEAARPVLERFRIREKVAVFEIYLE